MDNSKDGPLALEPGRKLRPSRGGSEERGEKRDLRPAAALLPSGTSSQADTEEG